MPYDEMERGFPLGRKSIEDILAGVLEQMDGEINEVSLFARRFDLTRCAKSDITENTSQTEVAIKVRTAENGSVGHASANSLEAVAVENMIKSARRNAQISGKNLTAMSFSKGCECSSARPYHSETAMYEGSDRVRGVADVCRLAPPGVDASGFLSIETAEMAVMNSNGVFAYAPTTAAKAEVYMTTDSSAGYAEAYSPNINGICPEEIAERAVQKAEKGRRPLEIRPEKLTVILEPAAVADLLGFIAAQGFSGAGFETGKGNYVPGRQMASTLIDLTDDASRSEGIAVPFDGEGFPRKKLTLIDHGRIGEMAYDSKTAEMFKRVNTGHGLSVAHSIWPTAPHIAANCQPMNMFLSAGDSSADELIAGVHKGIYVTRFNYNRLVNSSGAVVTGTTRGGTFLIEDGKVTRPVKNMRYTQSFIDSLMSVSGVGDTVCLHKSTFGTYSVPMLRIDGFNFTSVAAEV